MLPVLFNSAGITFFTFGIFLVLSLLWGSFWLWKSIKLTSYKEEDFFDGLFLSVIGGIFLGRLVFVSLNFSEFGFDILKFLLINGFPGLSLIGVLLGGFATFFLYTRIKKKSFLEMADYIISPLFLSLSISALGAFLSGTTAGTKTGFFLSSKYLGLEGFRHVPALYEALLFMLGFYFAYKIILLTRRHRLNIGTNTFFFILYFSLIYLLLDNLKVQRLYLGSFSFNLIATALLSLISGLYLLFVYKGSWSKLLHSGIFKKNHGTKKSINGKSNRFFQKKT